MSSHILIKYQRKNGEREGERKRRKRSDKRTQGQTANTPTVNVLNHCSRPFQRAKSSFCVFGVSTECPRAFGLFGGQILSPLWSFQLGYTACSPDLRSSSNRPSVKQRSVIPLPMLHPFSLRRNMLPSPKARGTTRKKLSWHD